jgi:hypothetical protein
MFSHADCITARIKQFIQSQLATGRYADVVIAAAPRWLENRNQYDQWADKIGTKIGVVAAELDRWVKKGIDGERAIEQLG